MVVVGLAAFAVGCLAVDARATYGAQTTADEPQYLLTALSLGEDGDLEITDELAERRWRQFHEAPLPVQTEAVDADGTLVSPHDPLLPVYLALPMALGGWVAAKVALAALAGALAALLVWVAVRRFAVPPLVAGVVVGAFAVSPPLVAYASQVYPELPAALAVTVAIAALTGPLGRGGRWALGLAVVALPWLGVKYAPVAVALAAVGLVRLWRAGERRGAVAVAAGLGAAGLVFLAAHQVIYGGWTVYAAGDHFTSGELSVVGSDPDYVGRSRRLVGLLLDRGFGLAAWSPAYLLAVPAAAVLARHRPSGWTALAVPFLAGWATATWVALTMHGWWWPGRQTVVVVPCLVLAVAWWAGTVAPAARRLVAGFGAVALASWVWLVAEVLAGRRTLIVDFEGTRNPLYRAWRAVLPDYRDPSTTTWLLQAVWLAGLAAAAALAASRSFRGREAPATGTSRHQNAVPASPPRPLVTTPSHQRQPEVPSP